MYVNKNYRIIVCCILIIILAFVPTHRVGAVVPAIPAAVYYAVAGTITYCGLNAATDGDLNKIVLDYWNNTADTLKSRWEFVASCGPALGYMAIDYSLTHSIMDYLTVNYNAGEGVKELDAGNTTEMEILQKYEGGTVYVDGKPFVFANFECYEDVARDSIILKHQILYDGVVLCDMNSELMRHVGVVSFNPSKTKWYWKNNGIFAVYWSYDRQNGETVNKACDLDLKPYADCGTIVHFTPELIRYIGDILGFGAALKDPPEVQIPCPPVPTPEWPDRWAGDLTGPMTGEGGEVIQGPTEWFKDKDTGKILYFPPGDPPPEYDPEKHEKLVPGPPPIYDPIHPPVGEPGPATPEPVPVPAPEPCPYCPPNPHPLNDPCPNPYCPNNPAPVTPPVPATPGQPVEPCPYCPPNPDPGLDPCPNPYCPNNPAPVSPPYPSSPPVPDDRYLDFDPLKKLPHIFTTKFPFSLPWDLKRGLESLQGGEWDRKFQIAACGEYWPEMEIDISMFDPIAGITRVVFLLVFDFALIFSTRKLMGGDV